MGCQDVNGQRQVAARVCGWVGRALSGVQKVLSKLAAPINFQEAQHAQQPCGGARPILAHLPLHKSCRRVWPVVRVVAAAAEELGGPIPEVQPAVAKLRRLAADCVPSSSSALMRHAPNISGPPELLGLLALRQAPCCNPRCCNLSGASETRLRGKLCTGCRMARFCCMECSKAAWAEHKVACKHMQQQLAAQARQGGEGGGRAGAQE